MANVPNTTTFTFQDVTTAVYNDTAAGRNLTAAFANATGVFDPAYVGGKTNLLNFRNYMSAAPATYTITIRTRNGSTPNDTGFYVTYVLNGVTYPAAFTSTSGMCVTKGTITGIAAGSTFSLNIYANGAGGAYPAGTRITMGATPSATCAATPTMCTFNAFINANLNLSIWGVTVAHEWVPC